MPLTILLVLTVLGAAPDSGAVPVLETSRAVVSVREGETLHKDAWRLAPAVKPDIYVAELKDGTPQTVTFVSDEGSVSFVVEVGKHYDFIIQHGTDRCETRIVGVRPVPAAVFDERYRQTHAGTISVEVPEVYELVNVAIALTPTGITDPNLVYPRSDYYRDMRQWFEPWRNHPAIAALEAVLKTDPSLYSNLKMNGYAFEFDASGRIVQSPAYDRTGFYSERSNSLRPSIPQLQSFADASKFRAFYAKHRSTYAAQIAFFEHDADVQRMRTWLGSQFPGVKAYDGYKIVFSPLVAYSQSSTWLESNGFRELQAHVNYPYPADVARWTKDPQLSDPARTAIRGAIVFTELNHGYINPEADRYAGRILKATAHRERWVDPARGPDYYAGLATFDEYMNWALISLRVVEVLPAAEQATIIAAVDELMTKRRGFSRFAAFDAFLVDLYRNRAPGQTIADLYPQIIAWFEAHDA